MSALATPARPNLGENRHDPGIDRRGIETQQLFEPGAETLEKLITSTWDDLAARVDTGCLVCGDALGSSGHCESCGSELS